MKYLICILRKKMVFLLVMVRRRKMNEKKVLKWIEVSWMVSMGLGMLFLGVYGLWLSRSIRWNVNSIYRRNNTFSSILYIWEYI